MGIMKPARKQGGRPTNVCFTPKSGHELVRRRCPLCAKSGHCPVTEPFLKRDRWKYYPRLAGSLARVHIT